MSNHLRDPLYQLEVPMISPEFSTFVPARKAVTSEDPLSTRHRSSYHPEYPFRPTHQNGRRRLSSSPGSRDDFGPIGYNYPVKPASVRELRPVTPYDFVRGDNPSRHSFQPTIQTFGVPGQGTISPKTPTAATGSHFLPSQPNPVNEPPRSRLVRSPDFQPVGSTEVPNAIMPQTVLSTSPTNSARAQYRAPSPTRPRASMTERRYGKPLTGGSAAVLSNSGSITSPPASVRTTGPLPPPDPEAVPTPSSTTVGAPTPRYMERGRGRGLVALYSPRVGDFQFREHSPDPRQAWAINDEGVPYPSRRRVSPRNRSGSGVAPAGRRRIDPGSGPRGFSAPSSLPGRGPPLPSAPIRKPSPPVASSLRMSGTDDITKRTFAGKVAPWSKTPLYVRQFGVRTTPPLEIDTDASGEDDDSAAAADDESVGDLALITPEQSPEHRDPGSGSETEIPVERSPGRRLTREVSSSPTGPQLVIDADDADSSSPEDDDDDDDDVGNVGENYNADYPGRRSPRIRQRRVKLYKGTVRSPAGFAQTPVAMASPAPVWEARSLPVLPPVPAADPAPPVNETHLLPPPAPLSPSLPSDVVEDKPSHEPVMPKLRVQTQSTGLVSSLISTVGAVSRPFLSPCVRSVTSLAHVLRDRSSASTGVGVSIAMARQYLLAASFLLVWLLASAYVRNWSIPRPLDRFDAEDLSSSSPLADRSVGVGPVTVFVAGVFSGLVMASHVGPAAAAAELDPIRPDVFGRWNWIFLAATAIDVIGLAR